MSKRPRKEPTEIFDVTKRLIDKASEHMKGERVMTSASTEAFTEKGPAYFAKAAKGQHEGGLTTAKIVQEKNAIRDAKIFKRYNELLATKNKRYIPAILEREFPIGRDMIRRIIKKGQ